MDRFFRCYLRYTLFLFGAASILLQFDDVVAERQVEEMQTLRMFYREEDLVVSPTRHPKPITQVAENISVITAEEIEAMNAHTVAEVLNRVAGVYVNFNQDFGASSLIFIQASEARHVLVLVDSVPWNFLSEGSAETNSIPVGIIDRIEVIKGPASSAWGSSLGGVINVITKPVGNTSRPAGKVRASFGKDNTQDLRAELSGNVGLLGYFLFAGYQNSDGLRDSREFENPSFYSKLNLPVYNKADLGISIGYSSPEVKLGDFPSQDISSTGHNRNLFTTASLDATFSEELSVDTALYYFQQKVVQKNNALGLGLNGPSGDLFLKTTFDEQTFGGNSKLIWKTGRHTVVLGGEYVHGKLDQSLDAGSVLQSFGVPATSDSNPDIDRWAIFANDTIVINRLAITPGIRYDYNDITGSFISPSLGVTYHVGENSILRASVARGFNVPPLSFTSSSGLFLDPNPDLEPEEVWSYQAGAETASIPYLWLKATVFYHDLDDRLEREFLGGGPPRFNDIFTNSGRIKRQGIEIELLTAPVYNFSFRGNFAYTDLSPSNDTGSDMTWAYNLGLQYDDKKSLTAQLFGHYIWWDVDPIFEASHNDIIWDFNLNYKIKTTGKVIVDLFFTGHNLLNGDQYFQGDNKNPRRWAEAGIQFTF